MLTSWFGDAVTLPRDQTIQLDISQCIYES
jgi:hypothetical protein